MKAVFCFFLLFVISTPFLIAQNIFQSLDKKVENQGTVTIRQSGKIADLLDKKVSENDSKKHIYITGFRVQVYMGNSQKKSKADAFDREKRIKDKFQNVPTYVSFNSPFWKLRVGDFRTYTDALVLAKKIRTEFPDMNGEVSVVQDDEVRDLELERAN